MTCSHEAWHRVWAAFNRGKSDPVRIPRPALAEVVACAGKIPGDLIVKQGKNGIRCRRAELLKFLTAHGETCGKGNDHDALD